MNKVFFSISVLILLFSGSSCRKILPPADISETVSFLVSLPSLAIAQFEVRCDTEDIFLDQVQIQSPSGGYITEEFDNQRIARNENFLVGNQVAEDGMWLITFIGSSAITDATFRKSYGYEMVISAPGMH